jgi:hypothetical protein
MGAVAFVGVVYGSDMTIPPCMPWPGVIVDVGNQHFVNSASWTLKLQFTGMQSARS